MLARSALDDVAIDSHAIDSHRLNALLHAIRVLDGDVKFSTAKHSLHAIFLHVGRETRVDLYAIVGWLDAEEELADGVPHPSCCTCKPRVLALTWLGGILACYHLTVDVWLNLVECLILDVHWANLAEEFPCVVASTGNSLAYDDPRIVVAEDACILLISLWVRGNLAHLNMIGGVGWIV